MLNQSGINCKTKKKRWNDFSKESKRSEKTNYNFKCHLNWKKKHWRKKNKQKSKRQKINTATIKRNQFNIHICIIMHISLADIFLSLSSPISTFVWLFLYYISFLLCQKYVHFTLVQFIFQIAAAPKYNNNIHILIRMCFFFFFF